ncbi:dnaJ homolog subfamily A member 2-like [Halichondria panicea]|uniref:dnaJ homolog subfamily A member 2-like n=1 Tax=Halichondria panicea TaxID=6063 RepID=UPI00312B4092
MHDMCTDCGGSGIKVTHRPLGPGMMQQIQSVCTDCGGSVIKVTHRPLGPGMMQQIQSVCTDCGGSGDYIEDKDKCKKCKGKRLVEINHKQENTAGDDHSDKVPVSMGMRHESKRFLSEAWLMRCQMESHLTAAGSHRLYRRID